MITKQLLAIVGALLLASSANAQQVPPLRLMNSGTLLPLRYRLNIIGASCVDNSGSARTDCTVTGGGGGGSSTLAAAYTTGASQTDSTLLLDATRLGLRIRDNAAPIAGSLFQLQSSAGASTFFDITAASTQAIKSGMADGAAAIALKLDTSTAWSNATGRLLSLRTNASEMLGVYSDGSVSVAANAGFGYGATGGGGSLTAGMVISGAGNGLQFRASGVYAVTVINTEMYSQNDLVIALGDAAHRWSETWSRRYAGVEQTIAGAATLVVDPAAGESVRLTLNATAVGASGITAASGYPGELLRLQIIQDATGSRPLGGSGFSATWWLFAGGSYSVTPTANKRDILTFQWDSVSSKWCEISRSINL